MRRFCIVGLLVTLAGLLTVPSHQGTPAQPAVAYADDSDIAITRTVIGEPSPSMAADPNLPVVQDVFEGIDVSGAWIRALRLSLQQLTTVAPRLIPMAQICGLWEGIMIV